MHASTLLALLASPLLSLAAPAPVSPNPVRRNIPGYITSCDHGMALTFDDGPYIYLPSLVSAISGHARATLFVNGNNYGCIYDETNVKNLRLAYEAGFTIGSHTWSHDDIATNSIAHLGASLDLLETALWKILGVKPALFRAPYGSYTTATVTYLNSRGYTVVGWNLDTGDSVGASVSESIAAMKTAGTGSIILGHETIETTVDSVIPSTIGWLADHGAQFLTVDQCLNTNAYQAVGTYGVRDATWTCTGTPAPGE
jgi:peptidoglycan/xylan/chitin deacetylase (PgdA/CDA1 family)